jgi:hypothetical protein
MSSFSLSLTRPLRQAGSSLSERLRLSLKIDLTAITIDDFIPDAIAGARRLVDDRRFSKVKWDSAFPLYLRGEEPGDVQPGARRAWCG